MHILAQASFYKKANKSETNKMQSDAFISGKSIYATVFGLFKKVSPNMCNSDLFPTYIIDYFISCTAYFGQLSLI